MVDEKETPKSHLQVDKDPVWWDWWSENPVEILLVLFILVLFFTIPRDGCGIEADEDVREPAAVEQSE